MTQALKIALPPLNYNVLLIPCYKLSILTTKYFLIIYASFFVEIKILKEMIRIFLENKKFIELFTLV